MKRKLEVLLFASALLAAAGAARADCCSFPNYAVGSQSCNIFGCNCSGPCSNWGYTCDNGPASLNNVMGHCPGWQVCADNSVCGPGWHCGTHDNGTIGCARNKTLANLSEWALPRKPIAVTAPAISASAAERFRAIDTNHDGRLSFAEVKAWAAKGGVHLSDDELKKKFDEVDANRDGAIHPAEFDKPAVPKKK